MSDDTKEPRQEPEGTQFKVRENRHKTFCENAGEMPVLSDGELAIYAAAYVSALNGRVSRAETRDLPGNMLTPLGKARSAIATFRASIGLPDDLPSAQELALYVAGLPMPSALPPGLQRTFGKRYDVITVDDIMRKSQAQSERDALYDWYKEVKPQPPIPVTIVRPKESGLPPIEYEGAMALDDDGRDTRED